MASLTYEELSVILRIVNDNDSILEANINWFTKSFPKTEHIRICCGIGLLIHDSILVNKQRVVAAVILCGVHRNDTEYLNPFLNMLLETVQKYTTTTMEKSILSKLLRNPKYYSEIIKKTINQVFVEFSAKEADELDTNEIQTLRERYEENGPPVIGIKTMGIPGVLSVSNHPTASVEDILTGAMNDSRDELYGTHWTEDELIEEARTLELLYNAEALKKSYLTPSFVQFGPGLMEISNEELCWIDMPEPPVLVTLPEDTNSSGDKLIATSSSDSSNEAEMFALLKSASTEQLSVSNKTLLMNWLKVSTTTISVKSSPLSSETLPGLIENNWQVAAQCLIKIVPQDAELLRVMETSVLTFHSIEVFSQLHASDLELPVDFIHRYLSKCMQTCENTRDKSTQNRFLRLVCTLLQSLVRRNIYNIKGLFPEIQAFCTTFCKTKEANQLFGMIKAIENST